MDWLWQVRLTDFNKKLHIKFLMEFVTRSQNMNQVFLYCFDILFSANITVCRMGFCKLNEHKDPKQILLSNILFK